MRKGNMPNNAGPVEGAEGGGTRCTARALHKDDADRERHSKMDFFEGRGTALDQLVGVVKSMETGR